MIAWLLLIVVVAVFVLAVLLLVPALEVWRTERKQKRRGGYLP